jgi:hypothetical protein
MLLYKVVELSTVTDKDVEDVINKAVKDGWNFDGINFAMRDSSKRPSMAFVIFTRSDEEDSTA